MKKTKIIVPAIAALVLGLGAAVSSTVAWYTADANAKVNVAAATGNLTSTASSIDAGDYTINFTVTPTDSELELSHVATGAEASSGVSGIAAASLNEGDLIYGVISNGTATMRKCATSSNFVSGYTITASWASAPTDPADIAYLGGKSFTINLSVGGNAKFLASNGVTGLVNATSATAVVSIASSTLALSVGSYSHEYVHIEPTSLSASESGTSGSVSVVEASNVSLA